MFSSACPAVNVRFERGSLPRGRRSARRYAGYRLRINSALNTLAIARGGRRRNSRAGRQSRGLTSSFREKPLGSQRRASNRSAMVIRVSGERSRSLKKAARARARAYTRVDKQRRRRRPMRAVRLTQQRVRERSPVVHEKRRKPMRKDFAHVIRS